MTNTATKARRTKRPAADPEARAEQLAAMHAQLTERVSELITSDGWQAMLRTAARFHNYSLNNLLLISAQCPHATRVAGYKAWQAMGRQVRANPNPGQPYAIRIMAPMVGKEDRTDPDSPSRVFGFRAASVFDISQTDGEPLPEQIRPVMVAGDAPEGMWTDLANKAATAGLEIKRETSPSSPSADGSLVYAERVIYVSPNLSEAHACLTLAHELAHFHLGHGQETGRRDKRSRVEVEAESVAYIVAQTWGLDSSSDSLAYVAGWAEKGKESEVMAETAARVITAARKITSADA